MDANKAYGTKFNTVPTNPNVAYAGGGTTNTIPTDTNVAYSTHPPQIAT